MKFLKNEFASRFLHVIIISFKSCIYLKTREIDTILEICIEQG